MSIRHHSEKVSRTAHFSTFGTLSKGTRHIWFVFHGYGQLSSRIIKKFTFLDPETHFVIAPEGLSRFYWHGNNEPVASWMTKEDRYDEINDFVLYLNQLYDRFCRHINQSVRIYFLGFSQGCATAWRWIHASQPRYDVLVNWAGWVPEDISYLHLKDYFENKRHLMVYGDQDTFITDKTIQGIQDVIKKNQLNMDVRQFSGGHKIPQEELKRLVPVITGEDG